MAHAIVLTHEPNNPSLYFHTLNSSDAVASLQAFLPEAQAFFSKRAGSLSKNTLTLERGSDSLGTAPCIRVKFGSAKAKIQSASALVRNLRRILRESSAGSGLE